MTPEQLQKRIEVLERKLEKMERFIHIKSNTVRITVPVEFLGYITIKGVKIDSGSGSPEGAVDGNRGSLYLRTGTVAGKQSYNKESAIGTKTSWSQLT